MPERGTIKHKPAITGLAVLYGVKPIRLREQVKRNIKRFPDNFMFQLIKEEMEIWKSQIVISFRKKREIGVRRES